MPSLDSAISPSSRNPACAIDEYARMRFTSVWVRPKIAPTAIDVMATAHMSGRQSHLVEEKPTYSTRISAPNAAIFVHDAMNAVTAVGEPWYTSGVQLWNGATLALNS